MATFEIVQEDLSNSVTFLEQFLTVKMPKYDFSEGTANRDIAINSMAYIIAFFRSEIQNVKNRQSLLKLSDISGDDSADEVVDEILSDWFLTRKTGRASSGNVTLRFSRENIGVVLLTSDKTFTKSGKTFTIDGESLTLQSTDLTRNTDNLGVSYWTVSVRLVATDVGEDYDIDPGTFDEFPNVSPYLVSVTNAKKFSGGKSKETSDEMVLRSKTAVTVRDLNTEPSIQTVLTDTFAQVHEVSPVGMGDTEMLRDRIEIPRGSGNSVVIHRGSMIDAYVKFPLSFEQTYSEVFPAEGGLLVSTYSVNDVSVAAVKLPAFPIYKIRNLLDTTSSPAKEVPYTVVTDTVDSWNSSRQGIYLVVATDYLSQKLDLVYDTVVGYDEVQAFVESRRNRIIVADLLCKASYALYLKFEIRYYPSASGITDETVAKTSLQTFIHGRSLGSDFRVAEIIEKFTTDNPGNIVQLPFVVVGELLLPNGKILTITYEDKIETPERYAFSPSDPDTLTPLFAGDSDPVGQTVVELPGLQVSGRTMRYVVGLSDITLTEV